MMVTDAPAVSDALERFRSAPEVPTDPITLRLVVEVAVPVSLPVAIINHVAVPVVPIVPDHAVDSLLICPVAGTYCQLQALIAGAPAVSDRKSVV